MNTAISKNYGRYNVNVENNNSRIDFLGQFNIKVKPEPIETTEIKIIEWNIERVLIMLIS